MEIITVDQNNLEKEHICCAISSNNDIQVKAKKAWLEEQFKCGLIFKKMDVRGKCFIEYLPLEEAWVPIVMILCILIVFGYLENIKDRD